MCVCTWVESTYVYFSFLHVGSFLLVWHLVALQSLLPICGCIKSDFSQLQSAVFFVLSHLSSPVFRQIDFLFFVIVLVSIWFDKPWFPCIYFAPSVFPAMIDNCMHCNHVTLCFGC